ncbi:MAG: sodium-dependent transporter [Methylophilaceae bacterium]
MTDRGAWANRWTFILATTGSAIGLGNIWKLPYMIGVNGGSAFVLIYILSIIFVGIPLLMTEVMLGRRMQKNPMSAMEHLAKESKVSSAWKYVGAMGMLTGVLILCFYSVIGGWVLSYIGQAAQSNFTNITGAQSSANFDALLASPLTLLFWHTIFMVVTMSIVARGVNSGLEKANNFLIPALFAILLVLLGYSMSVGDMLASAKFMFTPDFSKLTSTAALAALGHAFFSLSIGMGAVMVYGSYLQRDASIARTSIYIAIADSLLGLLAGLAIYALVFANNLEPGAGPGLIFQTLPIAFGQMPWGNFFGTLFFILVAFAAATSAISLVEPTIAWFVENTRVSRKLAATGLGILVWTIGVGVLLSFNIWQDVKIVFGLSIFDTLDKLTSTIMLPLGGLLMAIFAGYIMKKEYSQQELNLKTSGYQLWRITNSIIAPIAIIAVFLFLLKS